MYLFKVHIHYYINVWTGKLRVNLLVRGHSVKSKDCFHDDQQVTVSLSFGISCSGHILLLDLAVD